MEIEELEKKLQNFKDEQQQQKLRGLNNYNIMGVLRKLHAEVGMHSNFIYSLLDIEAEHYQGDLFAKLFVKYVLKIDDFGKIKKVEMEENADGRRIDFTIKSDKYFIGIEMKIYASDEPNQISDYHIDLVEKAKAKDILEDKVRIYYLTLDGKKASYNSHQDKPYTSIAFNNEIINWLKECQKQVSNITNLNNAIGYYKDVVNMLIDKYESPVNQYKDFFLKDEGAYGCYSKYDNKNKIIENFIDIKDEINNGFVDVKQILHNNFYSKLVVSILDSDLEFKEYYENSESARKIDGDVITMTLYEKFDLKLFIKKNKFVTICVGINNNFNFGDDTIKKLYKENVSNHLKIYETGVKKGEKLNTDVLIAKNSINNLFLAQKNKVEKLDEEIINEIQKHINIIKEVLSK